LEKAKAIFDDALGLFFFPPANRFESSINSERCRGQASGVTIMAIALN
jgi:hypothetical protein